jgi:hypothetical protein
VKTLFAAAAVAAGLMAAGSASAGIILSQNFEGIDVSDNGSHPGFSTDYAYRTGTANTPDHVNSMYDEGTWTIGTNPFTSHELWKNQDLGSNWLILNGKVTEPSSIAWSQSVDVNPGDFTFSFDATDVCCNAAFDPANNAASLLSFDYSLDGGLTYHQLAAINTHTTPTNSGDGYHVEGAFTLDSSVSPLFDADHGATLKVSMLNASGAAGGNDFAIDNITLSAVPEPTSWALMLVGFGGMGAMMRANRRRMVPALVRIPS